MTIWLLLQIFGCCALLAGSKTWDYIIIGAGPAGLQMGYFLQQSNRDYIILEKENTPGSFFRTYPRHGRLNTFNKIFTGSKNEEFNLRHDWHSLLTDNPGLRFSKFSSEFFPQRESMLLYLQNFQNQTRLNVLYEIEIRQVFLSRNNSDNRRSFILMDQSGVSYHCRTLLVATGMWKPVILDLPWMNMTEGYETISTDPRHYEAKNILIIGHGNSAFETAQHIYPHTNFVHVLGRSRVRMAWETHYAGDLRGINNDIIDTYQLKSLDGIFEGPFQMADFVERGGRLYIDEDLYQKDNFAAREAYDKIIRCLGFHFDYSIFVNKTRLSRGTGRLWKYPHIGHDFQSRDIPGLYVLGAPAHSLDYRKSAGGFIHGFRYTIRSLHRLLNWRNHKIRWPFQTLPLHDLLTHVMKRINEGSGIYHMHGFLADVIVFRNETTFDYFEEYPIGLLKDFYKSTGSNLKRVITISMQYGDMYSGLGKDVFNKHRRVKKHHEAHLSSSLHPVLNFYKNFPSRPDTELWDTQLPKPDALHHVIEDFLSRWDGLLRHILPLRKFLERCIGMNIRESDAYSCFRMSLTNRFLPQECTMFARAKGICIP